MWLTTVLFALLTTTPKAHMEKTTAELRSIVASSEKIEKKRNRLRQITKANVDFAELAQATLGAEWQKLDKKKQAEFTKLLEDLIEASYVGRMTESSTVDIAFSDEQQDGDVATVASVAKVKGADVALKFSLVSVGDAWRVKDVEVDEVSLTRNYRSQFTKAIQKSGYNDFVSKLKKKVSELQKPTA